MFSCGIGIHGMGKVIAIRIDAISGKDVARGKTSPVVCPCLSNACSFDQQLTLTTVNFRRFHVMRINAQRKQLTVWLALTAIWTGTHNGSNDFVFGSEKEIFRNSPLYDWLTLKAPNYVRSY